MLSTAFESAFANSKYARRSIVMEDGHIPNFILLHSFALAYPLISVSLIWTILLNFMVSQLQSPRLVSVIATWFEKINASAGFQKFSQLSLFRPSPSPILYNFKSSMVHVGSFYT